MADQQTNTGQSNFTQVVSLLRQAESLLSSVSNSDNTVANNTNASLRPPNSSTVTENSNVDSVPSVATTSTSSDRSLANFRSLFSSYNRGSFRQNSSRASSAPPPKRKRTLSQFVPKDTWTHEFFCLADRHQNYQPTRGRKCDLQLAGGASNKDLVVIHPPPSGYSVPFLREASGLGQALAYIRPIQSSLNMDQVQPNSSQDMLSNSVQCPQVKCRHCHQELPMTEVRQHQQLCPEISSSYSLDGFLNMDEDEDDDLDDLPTTGSDEVVIVEEVVADEVLRPIFPQLSNDELREASERYLSVDDAIDGLLEKIPGGNGKYFSFIISNITSKKTGTSINEKLIFNKWKL
ncbi:Hypothetical predicted protein [Paramuricea clavata]|uniref:Uncharacterized protein n=1 Tax=Paramuricea clavata TaxID=317549 RepID=A0A7D9LH18_PARCT|nr:Hypothetical predicted protein [Paramuricea clavata]